MKAKSSILLEHERECLQYHFTFKYNHAYLESTCTLSDNSRDVQCLTVVLTEGAIP